MAIKDPQISRFAILTLADIKSAIEVFDSGESNVFEVMQVITSAVEEYQAATIMRVQQARPHRDAA